jgi:RND family efflux transporter MFP subunit
MKVSLTLCALASGCLLLAGCGKGTAPEGPVVRPIKTLVVGAETTVPSRSFPGKVLAGKRVQLAFDVAGTIIELNAQEGDHVKAGDVIARLDPRDFENARDAAKAELDRASAQYERVKYAADLNAVSRQELSNVRAARDVAKAQLDTAQKALEDSVLKARFNGVLANRYVDNFTAVQPKQRIVSLQDFSSVEIEVYLPETRLISEDPRRFNNKDAGVDLAAAFDSLPRVQLPVQVKEFSTDADPVTQTYRIVVTMPAPTNFLILPGMTASILATPKLSALTGENSGYLLPLIAIPVDPVSGQYYVWVVPETSNGISKLQKRFVEVGETRGHLILVKAGVDKNERIALTGAHLLQEGQPVRAID